MYPMVDWLNCDYYYPIKLAHTVDFKKQQKKKKKREKNLKLVMGKRNNKQKVKRRERFNTRMRKRMDAKRNQTDRKNEKFQTELEKWISPIIFSTKGYRYDAQSRFECEGKYLIKEYVNIGLSIRLSERYSNYVAQKVFNKYVNRSLQKLIDLEEMYQDTEWPMTIWRKIGNKIHIQNRKAKREIRTYHSGNLFYCVICAEIVDKIFVCGDCKQGTRYCSRKCQKYDWKYSHRFVCCL